MLEEPQNPHTNNLMVAVRYSLALQQLGPGALMVGPREWEGSSRIPCWRKEPRARRMKSQNPEVLGALGPYPGPRAERTQRPRDNSIRPCLVESEKPLAGCMGTP